MWRVTQTASFHKSNKFREDAGREASVYSVESKVEGCTFACSFSVITGRDSEGVVAEDSSYLLMFRSGAAVH